ncbi:MFS transporter, partial [Klebsiella pneumoniae]
ANDSINLVIGGGMAAGPALAGALLQHFASADPRYAIAALLFTFHLDLRAALYSRPRGRAR